MQPLGNPAEGTPTLGGGFRTIGGGSCFLYLLDFDAQLHRFRQTYGL
jgi:hypothetical protein